MSRHNIIRKAFHPKGIFGSCSNFRRNFLDIKTCRAMCSCVRNRKCFGFVKSIFRISHSDIVLEIRKVFILVMTLRVTVVWRKGEVPNIWNRAEGVYKKEESSFVQF